MPDLPEILRRMGVVGAGGAGFPAEVKAAAHAEFLLANGAECEPLLHKDLEIMSRYPREICAGMELMMRSTGAAQGKFGIKEKTNLPWRLSIRKRQSAQSTWCFSAISIRPGTSMN